MSNEILTWIFNGLENAIVYVLDIRWHELPYKLLYMGVVIGFGYCTALIVFCFPLSIIEAIIKKKLNDKVENKVIKILSTLFSIIFFLALFQ